ncbi:MAG: hypothetical protein FWD73_00150 [Polyangiaceae bacterium]|nr:hypothetical protein [Polyangiaceae bacterium]
MSTQSTRWRLEPFAAYAFVAICALCIALIQPSLAAHAHEIRQRDDVFFLPPPAELRTMTLGYRAAIIDLFWAKLTVEYGAHWQDKRAFPNVTRYIDGILAIEPDFPPLYRFVDTFLVFTPTGATADDARKARAYLERGTRERPNDASVWLQYGQFLAFVAPSFLKDKSEIENYRAQGAAAMARSVELGADAQHALAASAIMSKAGQAKATIAFLQRAYAISDDPDTRQKIRLKLEELHAAAESDNAR